MGKRQSQVSSDVDLKIKGSEFIELPKPFGLFEYSKLMTGTQGGQEKSGLELAALNNSMKELVRISKEISDFTKQTVEATKKLKGDHFA